MSEIHGATGSYVVNALDPDEFDEFEAHLAVCPTCRHEIVEFCETAAELSLLAAAPPPPPALRDSILSSIAEVRPLPPLEASPRRALPGDLGDVTESYDEDAAPIAPVMAAASVEPVVDELAQRRERREHRRTRVLSVLVAAVTVVALALGISVVSLVQGQRAPQSAGADASLLAAPDAKIVPAKLPNGATVSFVVSKTENRAMFVSADLPSPGAGKAYQLWTLKGTVASPDALLAGGVNQRAWFTGPIKESTALAVTIEPDTGSKTPTGTVTSINL